MTDESFKVLIQGIIALGAIGGPILLAMVNGRIAQRQAEKVKEVKETLEAADRRSVSTAATVEKVHTLVNSGMGIQLRKVRDKALRVYQLSGEEGDRIEAEAAQREYDEHQAKQARVDGGTEGRVEVAPDRGEILTREEGEARERSRGSPGAKG